MALADRRTKIDDPLEIVQPQNAVGLRQSLRKRAGGSQRREEDYAFVDALLAKRWL